MMADSGPVFWNLDGSHMDEDFAFSFCRTYEEWESDHRGWEEFQERFRRAQASEPVQVADETGGKRPGEVLRRTNLLSAGGSESTQLNLFVLGRSLAELICEIKDQGIRTPAIISGLNRDFANLRQAIGDAQTSLIEPVAARFTEHLEDLCSTHEPLRPKCLETQQQLATLLRRLQPENRR